MSDFRTVVAGEMPTTVERQHHALNESARRCYALRDASRLCGENERAAFYHQTGDRYFERATALLAEWTS